MISVRHKNNTSPCQCCLAYELYRHNLLGLVMVRVNYKALPTFWWLFSGLGRWELVTEVLWRMVFMYGYGLVSFMLPLPPSSLLAALLLWLRYGTVLFAHTRVIGRSVQLALCQPSTLFFIDHCTSFLTPLKFHQWSLRLWIMQMQFWRGLKVSRPSPYEESGASELTQPQHIT